jgi:hypothetical protein
MSAINKAMEEITLEEGDNLSTPEKMSLCGRLDRNMSAKVYRRGGRSTSGHGRDSSSRAEAGKLINNGGGRVDEEEVWEEATAEDIALDRIQADTM